MGAGCCLGLAPSVAPGVLLLLLPQPPPDAFTSPNAEEEEEEEEAALLVLSCADEDGSLKEAAPVAPSEGFAAEEEPAGCVETGRVGGVLFAEASLSGMEASWLQSSW